MRVVEYDLELAVEVVNTDVGMVSHGFDVLRRCSTETFGPLKKRNIIC